MRILIVHGVNLNMFGRRDPAHYGHATFAEINADIRELADSMDCGVEIFQSNHEGEVVEKIHSAMDAGFDALVINAGAWSHYSYAIADALAMLPIPVVEVHMSNIYGREEFRRHSVISAIAAGCIAGFGVGSYLLGLRAAVALAAKKS